MIIFYHMIKTAGMTFSYILRNNFGVNYSLVNPIKKNIDKYGEMIFTNDDLKIYLKLNPRLIAISGHYIRPYSLKKISGNDIAITFVRDPINRFLSGYNFGIEKGNFNVSLEEWINNPQQKNYQTKFIAGEENLEKAKNICKNIINFVGISEKFDISLLLLKNIYLENLNVYYQKKNVTNKKLIKIEDLSEKTLRKIKYINELDLELYHFINEEIFKNYLKNYSGDLRSDLLEFHRENENYNFNIFKINSYRIAHYFYYKPITWLLSKKRG